MEKEAEARIKASIVEAEKAAQRGRAAIDKATRAGIDVSKQSRELAEIEARVRRMKAVYVEGK